MISYFREQLATIGNCFDSFPEENFKKLVEHCTLVLKGGGKIIASGLGKNVPICEKFVGTMNSFGLEARFLHTNTAIHGDMGMINKNDVVLLLSKSGNTIESIILAEHLRKRNTETWLVGFSEDSKLTSMLKQRIILSLKDEGDLWNIVPNNSTIVFLIVLQGLAIQIAKRLEIKIEDFGINHPGGGIGEQLLTMD